MDDNIAIGSDDEVGSAPATDESAMDELRQMPVGTNDPNIVGTVGPTDIPPGSDPHEPGALTLAAADDAGDLGGHSSEAP
jgi:hypothetical protein